METGQGVVQGLREDKKPATGLIYRKSEKENVAI
jgi:hypothetical protein